MSTSLLLIPFVSAFTGWFVMWLAVRMIFYPAAPKKILGVTFQSAFSKKQRYFAKKIASLISSGLLSFNELEQKISDPASLQKLMPLIDVQIDNFLRVKLTETMPYITAFIGDKTIIQLKAVFMEELQTLFPELMKNYINQLRQDYNIEKVIETKLSALSAEKIRIAFDENVGKELNRIGFAAALTGFIIGALYLTVILLA